MKIRERLGGAGPPVLGAAAAMAVCCTIHLIVLSGGVGVLAATASRWWPAAALIAVAVAVAAAVAGVRIVRRSPGVIVDCCPTDVARPAKEDADVHAGRTAAIDDTHAAR